jgi:uncharacterized membrane protein
MRFLEYLFFKYYNWAIKVGDGDMPATTSIMCISFCVTLYVIDLVSFYFYFISPEASFGLFYLYLFVLTTIICDIVLYLVLVAKGRDKKIIEKHQEEWKGKKHWGAILFPIIAILVYGIELFIKMQMNRGRFL